MWIHILLSIFALLGYTYLGESFNYLMLPYVSYLFWSKDILHIPALLIQSISGGMMSIIILIYCLVSGIVYYGNIKRQKLHHLFLFILIPGPFILYKVHSILTQSGSLIEAFSYASMYLSVFPFFYISSFKKIPFKVIQNIIHILFALFILSVLKIEIIQGVYRSNALTIPLFTGYFLSSIVHKNLRSGVNFKIFILSVFVLLTVLILGQGLKFHVLLPSLAVAIISMFYFKKWDSFIRCINVRNLVIVGTLIFLYVVSNTYKVGDFTNFEMDYTDFSQYPKMITYKAMADRGPIWVGASEALFHSENWLLPENRIELSYQSYRGAEIENVKYGAHNGFLELGLQYGILVSIVISLTFAGIVSRSIQVLYTHQYRTIIIFISITILSVAFVGYMTGQFIFHPNFSFIFFSLAGCLYSYYIYSWRSNPVNINKEI